MQGGTIKISEQVLKTYRKNRERLNHHAWEDLRLFHTAERDDLSLAYRDSDVVIVWSGGTKCTVFPHGQKVYERTIPGDLRKIRHHMCRNGLAVFELLAAEYRGAIKGKPAEP